MPLTAVIIVAGGRGERFGSEVPKQYLPLAGSSVFRHTLLAFDSCAEISIIQPVIRAEDAELFTEISIGIETKTPVIGGETRQQSVINGLKALQDINPDIVLVHDAARPFVPSSLVSRVIKRVAEGIAAIPGVPVVDTLKRTDDSGTISDTVSREKLWRAQTPQGFAYQDLLSAHNHSDTLSQTDDSAVMEAAGHDVMIVEGDERNIKVTTPEDLDRMEDIMSDRKLLSPPTFRVGSGFDVHKLGPGSGIILCGVNIPSDLTLIGHSDADVAMHALTDAILGAAALGDIGSYFPPSDEKWRGVASEVFLKHAVDEAGELGLVLENADVTIICEVPKIGPHRDAMRRRLADIIGVSVDKISVKATTTERLGFTGRGEGIAAQASVLLCGAKVS